IPAERSEEEECILEHLRLGQRLEHFETVRLQKDGTRINVSVTISPIKNSVGQIIGASKIARDIRAQKKAQEELRQHRLHLEQLVAERTKELQEINTELQSFS